MWDDDFFDEDTTPWGDDAPGELVIGVTSRGTAGASLSSRDPVGGWKKPAYYTGERRHDRSSTSRFFDPGDVVEMAKAKFDDDSWLEEALTGPRLDVTAQNVRSVQAELDPESAWEDAIVYAEEHPTTVGAIAQFVALVYAPWWFNTLTMIMGYGFRDSPEDESWGEDFMSGMTWGTILYGTVSALDWYAGEGRGALAGAADAKADIEAAIEWWNTPSRSGFQLLEDEVMNPAIDWAADVINVDAWGGTTLPAADPSSAWMWMF